LKPKRAIEGKERLALRGLQEKRWGIIRVALIPGRHGLQWLLKENWARFEAGPHPDIPF